MIATADKKREPSVEPADDLSWRQDSDPGGSEFA
jgi:hypothetical protein